MHRARVNDKCPPKPRRAFVRLFVPTVKSGGRFLDKKTRAAPKRRPGRGRRFRTLGLRFWRPSLCQLSYSPKLLCDYTLFAVQCQEIISLRDFFLWRQKETPQTPKRKTLLVRLCAGDCVSLGGSTYIRCNPLVYTRLGCCLFRATARCAGALTWSVIREVRQLHPNLA